LIASAALAYRCVRQIKRSHDEGMTIADRSDTWRGLYASGLLGRFVVLCVGIWLHAADSLVTATIAPAIVDDIGGVAFINWTITLYQVGAIVAGAAAPLLCQRLGVRRVLESAALIYGGGCAIAGFAPSMGALLAGRLAQGMGGGMLLSLCYLAIQQWFAQSWWSRLFGIVALIWGAGSLLGPLIGGIFAGLHAWRMTFLAFGVQAAVLWVMAAVWLPSRVQARQAAKPWSVLPLLVLTFATLLIAESSVAARITMSIAESMLGATLLYLAARLDRRSRSRLFPVQVLDFRHPVGAGLLMVLALSIATTGFWAYGPLILKVLFGTRPIVSGYILAGEAVAWSLATLAVSTAPLSADRLLIRLGAALVALGAGGFAVAVPAGAMAGMVVCALLQGLGFGLCWPSIVHRLARFSDEAERPLAVTSPETMQRIGYAVGAAAVGIAANLSGLGEGISIAAVKSAAFWVFAAFIPVLIIALICAWVFTREPAGTSPRQTCDHWHPWG
jgi:MFS family permease